MALGSKANARAISWHPTYTWMVTFSRDGKRKTKYFKTRKAAHEFRSRVELEAKEVGIRSARPDEASHHAIAQARKHDLDLVACVQDQLAWRAAVETIRKCGGDIGAILSEAAFNLERDAQSITVTDLMQQYIRELAHDASDEHLTHQKSRIGRFCEDFGDRRISSITSDEIQDWIRALPFAPKTMSNYRIAIHCLFAFATHRWISNNPAGSVKTPKVVESEVGVFTPSAARALIESADKDIVPAIALGLFCGLRRAEIERLDWRFISFENRTVTIPASIAKAARRRVIQVRDSVFSWLLPYRGSTGKVWGKDARKLLERATADAGISWVPNGCRHSFASYCLAAEKNAESLALELGHKDTSLLFKHYRALVTESDAASYWAIAPDCQKIVAIG
jgi:integrase